MESNPLMDAFRKEFLRQVERAGFYHSAEENVDEINYKGRLIGTLTKNDGLEQAENLDEQDSKRFAQLQSLRERTLEPYALFREAAPLTVCDEPDTRVLCEFDRVALTARVRPDGAVAFATWQYRFDRTGNKYEPLDYITDPEFYPKRYLTPTSAALRPPYFILDTTREYGFGYSPGSKREYRYCIFDLTPEKRRGEFTTGTFRLYGGSLKDLRPKDYGFDTAKIKAVVGRKPKARQEPER